MPNYPITNEEREGFLAEFRKSGLTQAAFAEEHGINLLTLRSWLYRPRRKTKKVGTKETAPMCFVEVQGAPRLGSRSVLIRVGSSVEIEFYELPSPEYLVAIARTTC